MNGASNAIIRSAAADVAGHGLRNLIVGGLGSFGQQRRGGHDLPALAIAALGNIFNDPGLLQSVQTVG